ncbi:MAG TPA: FAD-dependent oxidoreductase, partial [Thermoleophilia bacterium]|nr:FAD-dependent oxidoreductase [Thermoleophilia bacterium]
MDKTVIIFGGGVAGLSAAQELGERGFKVTIYEKREVPGGKARSFSMPGSSTEGRMDLPAEHGFRFFPRFYRHVTDTMKRIPVEGNRRGVYDNLLQLTRMDVPRLNAPSFFMSARFPHSLPDLILSLQDVFVDLYSELGLTREEVIYFGERLWRVLTSCEARRADELERLSWWDFLDAGSRSEGYQKFLAQGLSKFLVAADARVTNAKVEGDIVI